MFGRENFCLDIICFVTMTSYALVTDIKQYHYVLEVNQSASNISTLEKIKVRSAAECASRCAQNDNCFLATFKKSTVECYIKTTGCPIQNTIFLTGWSILHKTDTCFSNCIHTGILYWERFCQGVTNAQSYCNVSQILNIKQAIYGNLACTNSALQLLTFPQCGKNVSYITEPLCNGKNSCSVVVNSATFGSTNCGGGENFYSEYACYKMISQALNKFKLDKGILS